MCREMKEVAAAHSKVVWLAGALMLMVVVDGSGCALGDTWEAVLLKDINPRGCSDPYELTNVDDTLFFEANNGPTDMSCGRVIG